MADDTDFENPDIDNPDIPNDSGLDLTPRAVDVAAGSTPQADSAHAGSGRRCRWPGFRPATDPW